MALKKAVAELLILGYQFNKDGRLQKIEDEDEKADIVEVDNEPILNVAIQEYVYGLMEESGLMRIELPNDMKKGPKAFLYVSDNWKNCDRLLILIQSSGEFRAGIWDMQTIIKANLAEGSQLPLITRALDEGMGVVVFNPNMNVVVDEPVDGSETPQDHVHSAFSFVIRQTSCPFIAIVGHKEGGIYVIELSNTYHEVFDKRVMTVQLVDSNHDPALHYVNHRLQESSVNYINYPYRINRGVVKKDRYTRQMSRINAACNAKVIQLLGEKTEAGEQAQEMLKYARTSKDFSNYNYENDPIFLDIPLFSAGKLCLDYEWTPTKVLDYIFLRINEVTSMLELKMQIWL